MLGIVAFIGIFIATYYAFKTAKDYDRNPWLWSAIVFAIGFGFQVIIPIALVIVIGVYKISTGTSPENLEAELGGIGTFISIVTVILSIIGMVLVLKHLGTIPDDYISDTSTKSEVPPPPKFDGN